MKRFSPLVSLIPSSHRVSPEKFIHRRRFLRQSIVTTGALSTFPTFADQPLDVLVIGAGPAGLACARPLFDSGLHVRVIEARDRLGGRVHTIRPWNFPVEMGARWIHSEKTNPLTAIAEQLSLTTHPTDYDSVDGFDEQGKRYTLDQLAESFLDQERFEKFLDEAADAGFRPGQEKSLQDAIDQWEQQNQWNADRRTRFHLAARSEITLDYGADFDQLAWPGFDHAADFVGRDLVIAEGYDRIIQYWAKQLPIDLETAAQEIDFTGNLVRVKTSRHEYSAKRVVVTVPLGVLQSGVIRFVPELPAEKQEAIDRLGMAHVSKVTLRFPQAFWPKREIFLFALEGGGSVEMYNLGLWNGQAALQSYQAGKAARAEEALPPRERAARLAKVIQRAFPDRFLEPTDFEVTVWSNDPWSRGAYSYVKVGAIPQHYEDLSLPVAGKLYFAGEATSREHASTVHGAYRSGLREAKRILSAS